MIFMKYTCLGYLEPGKFENMSESERNTVQSSPYRINDPWLSCRLEANALIEQEFELASDTGPVKRRKRGGIPLYRGHGPQAPEKRAYGKVAKRSGITQTLFVLEQGDPFRMMATLNGAKVVMPAVVPESLPAWLSP
jgi:hypothetical protein